MLLAGKKEKQLPSAKKKKKKYLPPAKTVWVSAIDLLNVTGMFSESSNF